MKTHICLVSEQAAANLLPALDWQMKPDEVVLVVSPKMMARASFLEPVLRENGIRVERLDLKNEHDYGETERQLLDLAAGLDGRQVSLNLTGGTKLMSVAAQSVAQASDWRMFYVDADTDQITWLGKDRSPPHKIEERLRLRHYLGSYGYRIEQEAPHPTHGWARQALIETLVGQIGSLERPLAQLNWLAQQAEDAGRLSVEMSEEQRDSRALEALLRHFSEAGLLTVEQAMIRFPDRASLSFVKGGWLELHVFKGVKSLTGETGIRDKALNLKVVGPRGEKVEFDTAFMARNRLFVIECKTARMDRPEAPKANDALFKLAENCRRVGGLATRGMLASYRPLREAERKLAEALRIELVCGAELARIKERLKAWIERR